MKRSNVRPSAGLSVCPISRPQQRRAVGLLLSARRAGDIDRLLHGRSPSSSSGAVQQAPALSSKRGQCHADS